MPRKGNYGVAGYHDDRFDAEVEGVFSTVHAVRRSRERNISMDTVRKSAPTPKASGRTIKTTDRGVTTVWDRRGTKAITTYVTKERRRDSNDGNRYTMAEFKDYYGDAAGIERWHASKPRVWKTMLPSKLIGGFIGKKGVLIEAFRRRYGVEVHFLDQPSTCSSGSSGSRGAGAASESDDSDDAQRGVAELKLRQEPDRPTAEDCSVRLWRQAVEAAEAFLLMGTYGVLLLQLYIDVIIVRTHLPMGCSTSLSFRQTVCCR